jgi:hypothetical protein
MGNAAEEASGNDHFFVDDTFATCLLGSIKKMQQQQQQKQQLDNLNND